MTPCHPAKLEQHKKTTQTNKNKQTTLPIDSSGNSSGNSTGIISGIISGIFFSWDRMPWPTQGQPRRTGGSPVPLRPRVRSPTSPCHSAPRGGAGKVPASRPFRGRRPKVTPRCQHARPPKKPWTFDRGALRDLPAGKATAGPTAG